MRTLILLFILLCTVAPLAADTPAIHFQAHRGGLHEVPENTMAAFYHAWRLRAIPEIDIRTTRDGVIVCLHDRTLKRTTNVYDQVDESVAMLSLAEVQRYDAGSWFGPEFAGERIPTLRQVFAVLRRHGNFQIYLDLKAADLTALATLIEEYGVARQIIFCHNDVTSCQTLKAAVPQIRTMLWIGGDADQIWSKFQSAKASGFAALDQVQLHLHPADDDAWPYALPQDRLVEALQSCKVAQVDLEVLPFQFTDRSLRTLIDLGIRWYATDEPLRFRRCIDEKGDTPSFFNNGVTAHRGDSGHYPENTMAAIDAALALGVDWIEIDIFHTADGEIVVTHDATTEKVGNQSLVVEESTLEALQALDVASGFRRSAGLDSERCPPATMPTLRQVILRLQGQHRTRLSIQPKSDVVDQAIALIRELKAEAWVGFNDGDLKKMSRVKELAPEIPVFWDRFEHSPLEDDLAIAQDRGFEAMVPHVAALSPDSVAMLKSGGLNVGAWTVNDTKTMRYLLDMGVDRIYTDYPDRLLALVK